MQAVSQHETNPIAGSLDGTGAGDHDKQYDFGWRPRASTTGPFSTREYARLLVLRSRVQDERLFNDQRPSA